MRRFLLGFLCLVTIGHQAAQAMMRSDTLRVDSLNARAFSFIGNSPDSMIAIAERALDLSRSVRYRKGEAFALSRIAIGRHLRGETNTIELLEQALKIQTELGDIQAQIGTLSNMANIHIATGAYDFAGERLHEALEAYVTLGDSVGMSNVWNNLGNLHRSMGQLGKALEYNRKALAYRELTRDTLLLSSSLNNVGNLLTDLNQLDEAQRIHERALLLNRAIGDRRSIANSLHNLGSIFIKQQDYARALEYYQNASRIREEIKDLRALVSALAGQAEAHLGLMDYRNAVIASERAYLLARQIGVPKEASDASRIAYQANKLSQNPGRALQYLEIHKHLSDSLVTLERQKAIANLESVAELNRKKDEIRILEQEQSYQRRLLAFILFGLALTLVFLAWIYQSRQREKKINTELHALGELKDRMFSILSHDLRSPLNSLHSMIELMDMDALTPQEWHSFKKTLIRQFDVTDETLRDVLLWAKGQFEGVKDAPTPVHLKDAVESNVELVNLIASRKGVSIQVDISEDAHMIADRAHLMAIIRNLLTNAVKFTPSGKSIHLHSTTQDGFAFLTIRDEGIGMREDEMEGLFKNAGTFKHGTGGESGNGLGLLFVRDLVRRNNGTVHVKSEYGLGSEFTVVLPAG